MCKPQHAWMQISTCLNRHAHNSCKIVTVIHGGYMRLEMVVSSPVVQSQDPFISYHSRDGVQTCLVFPHLPSLTWKEERRNIIIIPSPVLLLTSQSNISPHSASKQQTVITSNHLEWFRRHKTCTVNSKLPCCLMYSVPLCRSCAYFIKWVILVPDPIPLTQGLNATLDQVYV